ncbi:MAG: PEP-CTERM sorting domain-containing protein [Sulfuriferula multivorans]|uniref:PEP-CTERM sorting domain-containing protein n=1 Tax=Sulfuriferula multivorans TaxID=1559896 RepID=A0A7C9K1M3_9PROT|nr:PEP-CTERM sorting domain-containing protein [Sulfuriferula multivorans]
MNKTIQVAMSLTLAIVSFPALAVTVATIPEPGALSLFGIGAVAGLVIWAKNRKNKK